MTKSPEIYFLEGCGRCSLGGTPECKVHRWTAELQLLRSIILDCGLEEVAKWGVPCYMHGKSNVLVLSALKDTATIGFMKGALLDQTSHLLVEQAGTENVSRVLRFTSLEQIADNEAEIKALIYQAIEVENQGLKVEPKKSKELIPDELEHAFVQNPQLKDAFYSLTPGRQRGYLLHFNQAKQAATRASRIEKCVEKILRGEGMHDQYKN
jgi:uncharacterized protein YdeI (YjbR/CyaY-like superfamily)